jgi:CRISPR-associated helicase Cas3
MTAAEAVRTRVASPVQALLTGLVIMTDWIASDEERFEYLSFPAHNKLRSSFQRAADAWENLDLPPYWEAEEPSADAENLFLGRFGIESPRPIQTEVVRILSEANDPGIVVIEAPMGEGKTEAALAAVEILAAKAGKGGVFVGLPTMATSDGMFGRVKEWVDALGEDAGLRYSMFLAHGKAHLNETYRGLKINPNVGDEGADSAVANEWLQGRKKGVLADFVVGTADQLLFAALKTRHVALRHLAFANKAVIIDECHAYDAYMNSYLTRALEWLGKYRTPVVILSATLPLATRRKLVDAYMGAAEKKKAAANSPEIPQKPAWATNADYPLITYSDGETVRSAKTAPSGRKTAVSFEYLPDEDLPDKLLALLSDGGCAGVIRNTVDRAQTTMRLLEARFAETDTEVELLHARFLSIDRARKENALRGKLGPRSRVEDGSRPRRLIVVGTQVLEQSLDLDFDLLVSDIAPMDLLLQRVGRLHRHDRARPAKLREARCFVTGVADANEWVFAPHLEKIYSRHTLLNTLLLLPVAGNPVVLPDDISPLVQTAYAEPDEDGIGSAERLIGRDAAAGEENADARTKRNAYREARKQHEKTIDDKESRAKDFRLREPIARTDEETNSLIDWLDVTKGDKDDRRAEASVRDTTESLEVMIAQKKRDGRLYLLPWIGNETEQVPLGAEISAEYVPESAVARVAAACTVSLPALLCHPGIIDKVIGELEARAIALGLGNWQKSPWLKGLLPLILDENSQAEILCCVLEYDETMGLSAKNRNGGGDDRKRIQSFG